MKLGATLGLATGSTPVGMYKEFIRREFTSHIDIPDTLVLSPEGNNPQHAAEYDQRIQAAGGMDIQLLGVGTDGHIGFNEPGSSLRSSTRLKTLHPQTVVDNARFFNNDASQVPHHVVTQGIGTISRARKLLLLAAGTGKMDAVQALVEGRVSATCPASILQLHPNAVVVVDEDAVQKLAHADYYRYAYEHKPDWQVDE